MRSPISVSRGSTSQPLRRSSTTEANEPGDSPLPAERRVMRSTSPPIVEGRKFPTNNPAR